MKKWTMVNNGDKGSFALRLHQLGGIIIKKSWLIRGILFFLGVIFCTLFLNIDAFPMKMGAEAQIPQKSISTNTEPLFNLTPNPYIPDFILQGNYVIYGISPNKQYTAYLYPDEWETIGDIYIKDPVENRWVRMQLDQELRVKMWGSYAPDGKYTPKKKILWLNDEEFITIIGFAYGTVSQGGELVKVSWTTGEVEIIYPAYQKINQEVVDFALTENDLILYVNNFDANGLCQEKEEVLIPLNDLDSLS